MSKTWTTRRRGDEKDFLRSLRKGKTVYVIVQPGHIVPGVTVDSPTYSAHTVTGQHPLIGGWQIGNNMGAKSFFQWAGTVYDTPPAGLRHVSDPGPDCRDEGLYGLRRGEEFRGSLHPKDIADMQRLADQAEDRAKADKKAGRRSRWF